MFHPKGKSSIANSLLGYDNLREVGRKKKVSVRIKWHANANTYLFTSMTLSGQNGASLCCWPRAKIQDEDDFIQVL